VGPSSRTAAPSRAVEPATPTKSGSYLIWGVEPQSHGCIHMAPIQLQRMNAHGAFIRGTALTIHTYSEHHGR